MPRAPAGSVRVANQIHSAVRSIGVEKAAEKFRVTPGYIQRIESARTSGSLGKVWISPRAIKSWGERLVDRGRRAGPRATSERRERPAITKAGQRAQEIARGLKVKDIAKALGVSSQKASAERQKLLRGDIPKGEAGRTLERWKELAGKVEGEIKPFGVISSDGYAVIVFPDGSQPDGIDHTSPYDSSLIEAVGWLGKNGSSAIAVIIKTDNGWEIAYLKSSDRWGMIAATVTTWFDLEVEPEEIQVYDDTGETPPPSAITRKRRRTFSQAKKPITQGGPKYKPKEKGRVARRNRKP